MENIFHENTRAAFAKLKNSDSKHIADILTDAYNNGLLAICGGCFDEQDVEECTAALWIAIGMLRKSQ